MHNYAQIVAVEQMRKFLNLLFVKDHAPNGKNRKNQGEYSCQFRGSLFDVRIRRGRERGRRIRTRTRTRRKNKMNNDISFV